MNSNYIFAKNNFLRKFIFWSMIMVLVGLSILLLKQEYNSLSPAATRMFNALSSVK